MPEPDGNPAVRGDRAYEAAVSDFCVQIGNFGGKCYIWTHLTIPIMAIIDVVQWKGTPDIFAWRYPESNLTTFTQLLVNESQEAVFFHKGKLLQKFGPGKHTLSTENIPLLENLYGIPFGGENPFTAEVWFVNKVTALDIKWGTLKPFIVRDPEFGIMAPVRGFGQFGVRIADAETFLVKLVGTLPQFHKDKLTDYFRGLLLSHATSVIARTIKQEKVSVLDIAGHISELSDALQAEMQQQFSLYGIELVNFYVSQISVPEDDPTIKKLQETLSKRADMNLLGYTYQQDRSYDVLENASKNEGMAGTIMGAGMGIGLGFGAGGAMGGMMQDVAAQVRELQSRCSSCGTAFPQSSRFCPSCGQPAGAFAPGPDKKTVVCDKCGHEIPEGSKFCPSCGDVYNSCPACHADMPEGARICPSCGAEIPVPCTCGARIPAGARFCPSCGKSLRTVCPSCGEVTVSGQAFCVKCGTKIER